jgi:O-antigen/teichoic acid export membrane protein
MIAAGSLFLLLQVFALIGNASDSLVLAQILGVQAVAQYTVAQKLFSIALIAQFFIAPLWPAFGDALERNDYAWARHALKRALVLSLGITILATLPLLVFGKWIVVVWVGPELIPSSSLLAALGGWMLLASYGGVMSVLLNNGKLLRRQAVFYGVASLAALVLKIVLAQAIGISGVVWATVIGYGMFYVIPAGLLARSVLNIGPVMRDDERPCRLDKL